MVVGNVRQAEHVAPPASACDDHARALRIGVDGAVRYADRRGSYLKYARSGDRS